MVAREEVRLAMIASSLRSLPIEESTDALILLLGTFVSLLGRLLGDDMAIRLILQSWPDDEKRGSRPNPQRI
jgi:hypothetical protein